MRSDTHRKPSRRLLLIAAIALILVIGVTAGAAARITYDRSAVPREVKSVNRVDLSVDRTQFTFSKPQDGDELRAKIVVTVQKAEPDFYGLLHSVTIEGADVRERVYTPARANGAGYELPENVLLPASGGKTRPLSWTITFAVPYVSDQTEYKTEVTFDYTSGVSELTKQEYITRIPVTLLIED